MDDVPLRTAERGISSYEVNATPGNTNAEEVEPRGIVRVLQDFAEIFPDIAKGVKAAMPGRVNPKEWEDLFQDVALEAVVMHAENPDCFGAGKPKHWASHTARNRRLNKDRDEKNRVLGDEAYMRFLATGVITVKRPDEEYDERERDRAIGKLLQGVNPEHRKAVEARLIDGLSVKAAAAVGGISDKAFKRALEKVRRDAPLTLGDWHPNSTKKGRPSRAEKKPTPHRGTNDDQRS